MYYFFSYLAENPRNFYNFFYFHRKSHRNRSSVSWSRDPSSADPILWAERCRQQPEPLPAGVDGVEFCERREGGPPAHQLWSREQQQ